MTKYLISFPSEAMVLTDEEFPIVSAESHAARMATLTYKHSAWIVRD
ncbi:hypothetical protein J2W14_002351 [Pseudarthrobacter oxydans]|nr:hypothetical protein [Pseudarthrobacter oxydans]